MAGPASVRGPMNFTEDVLNAFPAARIALVAVDEDGRRRKWGFGELVARSAGLAGALEARGIGRGDVVMMLIGNRAEWVLAMLACFRVGAVALPCNTQLRRADLDAPDRGRRPGHRARRGALSRGASRRRRRT